MSHLHIHHLIGYIFLEFHTVASDILQYLCPILAECHMHACEQALQSVDRIQPFSQLSTLELKLGIISNVFSELIPGHENEIVSRFKNLLSLDKYLFFLSGLKCYHDDTLWKPELIRIYRQIREPENESDRS
jgi:hypothetical protein